MDPTTPSSDPELPPTVEPGYRSAAEWVDYVTQRRRVRTYDGRSLAALLIEPRIPPEALR